MMKTGIEDANSAQELSAKEFTTVIVEYITKVSSRYRGNEFTSSQLAKTILATAELEHTRFPIVHRIVKSILRTWEEEGFCDHIATTKYSRCRKTKDVYRFNDRGLRALKKQALEQTIETVEKREVRATPIMRTRESIMKDRITQFLDSMAMSQPTEGE